MSKIYYIFGGISEQELKSILDKSGLLTIQGKKLLARMGVETGIKMSIGKTTVQNLVNLYNAWKTPNHPIEHEGYAEILKMTSFLHVRSPRTLIGL